MLHRFIPNHGTWPSLGIIPAAQTLLWDRRRRTEKYVKYQWRLWGLTIESSACLSPLCACILKRADTCPQVHMHESLSHDQWLRCSAMQIMIPLCLTHSWSATATDHILTPNYSLCHTVWMHSNIWKYPSALYVDQNLLHPIHNPCTNTAVAWFFKLRTSFVWSKLAALW